MIYDDLFWINMIYEDLRWFLIIFDDDDDVNDDCGAWATHLDVDDGDLNGDGKDDDCEHQDVDSSDAKGRVPKKKPYFLWSFGNWIDDCQNEFYTWSHWKIYLFCQVIMVYFFH